MEFPSVTSTLVEVTSELHTPFRVFFKNELEQPSGSFKLRGIGYLVGKSIEQARALNKTGVEVFSSSGGNAGLAAAYAAQHYRVPCTVVLPTTSKPLVITKLQQLNANVVVQGRHWGEADAYLRDELIKALPSTTYPVYVHPFDDPIIWEGHAAIVDDLVTQLNREDLAKVKTVVCSVGGGGLYNGVVAGLQKNELLQQVPVMAIETRQAPTFHEAVSAGKLVVLDKVDTIATSLASPYISNQALANYKSHKTYLKLIDDQDAVQGSVDYYDTFGGLVEPACGASIAAVSLRRDLLHDLNLQQDDIVVIVVCGGVAISKELIEAYRQ